MVNKNADFGSSNVRFCSVASGFLMLLTATIVATPATGQTVLLSDVPHVHQKPDFCGEACVQMRLAHLGNQADQDAVFDAAALDPVLARGCWTSDLVRAIKKIGFDAGTVWHTVAPADADAQLNAMLQQIIADLRRSVPTIVCMHYNDQPNTTEHFRLIVGWDAKTNEVIYHEPAEARGAFQRMSREIFLKLWPLKYKPDAWTVISMPLEAPGNLNVLKSKGFTDADYCQHIMSLRKKLPNPSFNILIERPFVVIGDEPIETVKRRAKQTIGWAVDRIKRQYFGKDPDAIIDVWLFKDRDSYNQNVLRLFGRSPGTPYGYYSPSENALVMNIATGGGTLVHELVHPFIASNFPSCPSWFNEGLASLYEQSSSKGNKIVGLTNWRLAGLQRAITAGTVPPMKQLCSTSTQQFYNEDPGTHYSQARYLCYYLQQRGLLERYYHTFRANAASDPTGYLTLQKILGSPDMQAWQKEWHAYVMSLRFE